MTADDQTWGYRAGDWFGIFGRHVTVLLPPSEKHRVGALWEMADAGAAFDEILDVLIADGLRQLPGFLLVSEEGALTRVVLRGQARAVFTAGGDDVELDGSEATTWIERSLSDVSTMRLEVSEETAADRLVTAGGVARVASVEQPAGGPGGADLGGAAEEATGWAAPDEEPVSEPVSEPIPGPIPGPSLGPCPFEPCPGACPQATARKDGTRVGRRGTLSPCSIRSPGSMSRSSRSTTTS